MEFRIIGSELDLELLIGFRSKCIRDTWEELETTMVGSVKLNSSWNRTIILQDYILYTWLVDS
jgi:hypothetical protein